MCSLMVSEAILALDSYENTQRILKEWGRKARIRFVQISSPAPIFWVDKVKGIFQEKSHLPITLMYIQEYLLQAVTTNLGRF